MTIGEIRLPLGSDFVGFVLPSGNSVFSTACLWLNTFHPRSSLAVLPLQPVRAGDVVDGLERDPMLDGEGHVAGGVFLPEVLDDCLVEPPSCFGDFVIWKRWRSSS